MAMARNGQSYSPISTSRTATLMLASGTNATADASSIPGSTAAADGTRNTIMTGKK